MLTDTHLDFNKFDEDREAVPSAPWKRVSIHLIPALDYRSSVSAIKLAEAHPHCAAVGFHPTDLDKFSIKAFEETKLWRIIPKSSPSARSGLTTTG